jgi:tricarballylate dehydrogenase
METKQYDVVVAGCGVAGLSAAVSAAEGGRRVVLVERATQDERGGQSRYTEAYLRMKSETEVSDDFETHIADNCSGYIDPIVLAETDGDPQTGSCASRGLGALRPDVIQTLADEAGPTIAWLKRLGVRFDFLPTQFLTKSQPRLLPVGGGEALVQALAAQAERLNVSFLYETTAIKLEQDEGNQICGLFANRKKDKVLLRGRVVLACGGFEGNTEMLTRYLGARSVYLRPVCRGGYHNRGEGIQMALDIGAAPAGDFGSYHAEPIDPRAAGSEPSIMIFPYGILVNKRGRRFVDEGPGTIDAFYEWQTRRIYEQVDGMAYAILDAKYRQVPNYRLAIRSDRPPIVADSIETLADALQLPRTTLRATVDCYNAACRPGHYKPLELDGVATVALDPPKSNWALPIDEAPYHAFPIISSNVFTFGGLKIDSSARVLNANGDAMEGLYAAGETVGMYYRNYTGATSVLKGLVFGRIAGTHAARASS